MMGQTLVAIGMGLSIVFVFVGSPAELLREMRRVRDPVGLVAGVVVIAFIVGSFVVMTVRH